VWHHLEGRAGDRLKHLKRKKNAPIVSFEFMSAQKSATPDEIVKRNNINMLAHRFSIAPMMDWTDRAETTKQHQHLSMVEVSHAVPNAVPSR
jgi:ligand-binding SRPBCC domain-containing protein